ncbi:MAG: acyl-CoA thioesterase [Actinomycetota bacterium]
MARVRFQVPQRFADLDLLGHVNNVAYLVYVQEIRLKLLSRLLGDRLFRMNHVVVRNEIDYLRELGLGSEPLEVDAWVERIGASSYTIACEILDPAGQVAARSKTVLVRLGDDGSAEPLTDEERDLLAVAADGSGA